MAAILIRTLSILALSLLTSTLYAERGGHVGSYHGGGYHEGVHGNYHGGGAIYHGNEEAVIHPGYNYQNIEAGVVVLPGSASCTSQQICNSYGQCWSQQNCN